MYTIYRIVCFVTGEVYVGKTSKPNGRRRDHFSKLRSGKHSNPLLQMAFDAYGIGSFYFEILETSIPKQLGTQRERHWVNHFDSFNKGFNMTNSGQGKNEVECSWNGINYKSLKECSVANGVSLSAMLFRFRQGYRSDTEMYGSGIKTACTWNGTTYRSIRGAARKLGLPYHTLRNWVDKGYASDNDIPGGRKSRGVPCVWNGIEYKSIAEAARINNLRSDTLGSRIRRGIKSDNDMQKRRV